MEEIWKDVIGYEGLYQVSSLGEVKSLDRLIVNGFNTTEKRLFPGRVLKKYLRYDGYFEVSLSKLGVVKGYVIHRLVAMTFLQNPYNKREVNHINGVKTDNRVLNLEWCTPKENMQHAHATGLFKKQLPNKNFKHHRSLTDEQVLEILKIKSSTKITCKELGIKYKLSGKNIGCIIRGVTYKHIKR